MEQKSFYKRHVLPLTVLVATAAGAGLGYLIGDDCLDAYDYIQFGPEKQELGSKLVEKEDSYVLVETKEDGTVVETELNFLESALYLLGESMSENMGKRFKEGMRDCARKIGAEIGAGVGLVTGVCAYTLYVRRRRRREERKGK